MKRWNKKWENGKKRYYSYLRRKGVIYAITLVLIAMCCFVKRFFTGIPQVSRRRIVACLCTTVGLTALFLHATHSLMKSDEDYPTQQVQENADEIEGAEPEETPKSTDTPEPAETREPTVTPELTDIPVPSMPAEEIAAPEATPTMKEVPSPKAMPSMKAMPSPSRLPSPETKVEKEKKKNRKEKTDVSSAEDDIIRVTIPSHVNMSVNPFAPGGSGQITSKQFPITNESDFPIDARITSADLDIRQNGGMIQKNCSLNIDIWEHGTIILAIRNLRKGNNALDYPFTIARKNCAYIQFSGSLDKGTEHLWADKDLRVKVLFQFSKRDCARD